jgi:hypothetical protein
MEYIYWLGLGIILGMALVWCAMTNGGDQGER